MCYYQQGKGVVCATGVDVLVIEVRHLKVKLKLSQKMYTMFGHFLKPFLPL